MNTNEWHDPRKIDLIDQQEYMILNTSGYVHRAQWTYSHQAFTISGGYMYHIDDIVCVYLDAIPEIPQKFLDKLSDGVKEKFDYGF